MVLAKIIQELLCSCLLPRMSNPTFLYITRPFILKTEGTLWCMFQPYRALDCLLSKAIPINVLDNESNHRPIHGIHGIHDIRGHWRDGDLGSVWGPTCRVHPKDQSLIAPNFTRMEFLKASWQEGFPDFTQTLKGIVYLDGMPRGAWLWGAIHYPDLYFPPSYTENTLFAALALNVKTKHEPGRHRLI